VTKLSGSNRAGSSVHVSFGWWLSAILLAGVCLVSAVQRVAPTLGKYLGETRTYEEHQMLHRLYSGAAAYYSETHVLMDGSSARHCAVESASTSAILGEYNVYLIEDLPASFSAIRYPVDRPTKFQYSIRGPGGCGHRPGESIYTISAIGDLDQDGVQSLYEIYCSSNNDNQLDRDHRIRVVRQGE